MGGILNEILTWLIQRFFFELILIPIFNELNSLSADTIFNALSVVRIHSVMRSVGFAIFTLVVLWQGLKSIFGFAGVEAEEPAKLIFKTLIFGFALGYSKDILMFGINISNDIITYVLNNTYSSAGSNPFSNILSNPFIFITNTNNIIYSIANIIVMFKLVGIYLRLVERVVLNGFLVMGAPLAFAAGASQPTKGFSQGFIKVYIGNLVLMILQNLGVMILLTYLIQPTPVGIGKILAAFIALAIAKVITKLEDIVRDMSIGVGVGRDMGGALQSVQGMAYSGSMVMGGIKSLKGG